MRERSGKDGERGRREGVGEGEKWERWERGRREGVGEGEKWERWGERKEGKG